MSEHRPEPTKLEPYRNKTTSLNGSSATNLSFMFERTNFMRRSQSMQMNTPPLVKGNTRSASHAFDSKKACQIPSNSCETQSEADSRSSSDSPPPNLCKSSKPITDAVHRSSSWATCSLSSFPSVSTSNALPVIVRRSSRLSLDSHADVDTMSLATVSVNSKASSHATKLSARSHVSSSGSLDRKSCVSNGSTINFKKESWKDVREGSRGMSGCRGQSMRSSGRDMSIVSNASSVLSAIENEVEIPHYCPQRRLFPNWGDIPACQLESSEFLLCCECKREFDAVQRTPLRLFCFHNMCELCVLNQLKTSFWEIVCKCSKKTTLPAAYRLQYLRVNTQVLALAAKEI